MFKTSGEKQTPRAHTGNLPAGNQQRPHGKCMCESGSSRLNRTSHSQENVHILPFFAVPNTLKKKKNLMKQCQDKVKIKQFIFNVCATISGGDNVRNQN